MNETSYYLTLTELTQSVRLNTETIVAIVDCGIVEPIGDRPQQWQFEPQMVKLIHCACRLHRDLELDWPAVALALDLIEDLHRVREENQRLRRQLARLMDLDAT